MAATDAGSGPDTVVALLQLLESGEPHSRYITLDILRKELLDDFVSD